MGINKLNHKLAGFTIIETTLFLGISSFLIVALIAGTGNSLNIQRYNDAVETFKSTLQQQYADLTSVQNSRGNNWSCGISAVPTPSGPNPEIRGQSGCMLVGKYLRLENEKISIYRVVAHEKTSMTPESDDIVSLKTNYVLNVSKAEVDASTQEWGTKIAYPASEGGSTYPLPQNPRKIGILIVRSPDSGQIYTLTNKDSAVPDDASISPATFASMLVGGASIPGQSGLLICMESSGLLLDANRGVQIRSFAAGSSAIETVSNDQLVKNGSSLKC